jgi:hypothetical protein
MSLSDTLAPGFRHPGDHVARRVEKRTPTEMLNLLTLDALIATYGMDADELRELMLLGRSLYRGGRVTPRQALFLHDVARSPDDLAIDARPKEQLRAGWIFAVGQSACCKARASGR